jgi:hypothetical protein
MVCIGLGPGPKNVLAEHVDGRKTVVPYAIWKHRLSKEETNLADDSANFVTVAGTVQFDPQEREVSGKDVRDITIRAVHNQQKYRITLWPDLAHAEVARGDAVFVDGKGSKREKDGVTYNNVSAVAIVVNGTPYARVKDEVVNEQQPSAQSDDIPF